MVPKLALRIARCTVLFLTFCTLLPRVNAQIQVYGLWHCYDDACSWASVPNMTTFDTNNHWIIDRGNGSPSVNVVVLSFVDANGSLQQLDCVMASPRAASDALSLNREDVGAVVRELCDSVDVGPVVSEDVR